LQTVAGRRGLLLTDRENQFIENAASHRDLAEIGRFGSNASVELSWHVGFTPDFGLWLRRSELTLRAITRHPKPSGPSIQSLIDFATSRAH
jgi:hypothetical protein